MILTDPEIRVLGCLIEKEITTPEYYPLSLNALVTACNQRTNREPVVNYTDCTVGEAAQSLREKGLVILAGGRDDRVPKFDNYFADFFHLSPAEAAVMDVLMLRGPQTAGELRGRAERLHEFREVAEVEAVLDGLAAREEGAFVVKLPRQPGQKECRYAHLLAGEPSAELTSYELASEASGKVCSEIERIERMEQELAVLRQEFAEFKKQFE